MKVAVYREDGSVLQLDSVRHVKIEFLTRRPFMLKIRKIWHIHGYKC